MTTGEGGAEVTELLKHVDQRSDSTENIWCIKKDAEEEVHRKLTLANISSIQRRSRDTKGGLRLVSVCFRLA